MKDGRALSLAGIILSVLVFMSIFLTYPYTEGIKQMAMLWLIASFYLPLLLGVLSNVQGDKTLSKAVIILGIFIIIFFVAALISATLL